MTRVLVAALALSLTACASGFSPEGNDYHGLGAALIGAAAQPWPVPAVAPTASRQGFTCRQSTWPDLAGHYTVTCE